MKTIFFLLTLLTVIPFPIFGEGDGLKIYTGGQAWRLCGIKPPPPPGKLPSEMVCACLDGECKWMVFEINR